MKKKSFWGKRKKKKKKEKLNYLVTKKSVCFLQGKKTYFVSGEEK